MHRNTLLAPLALLSLAACGGSSDGPAGIELQTLSGRVTTPGVSALLALGGTPTENPVGGATVRFEGRTTTTDPNGVFVFTQAGKVPPGQNRIEVLGSAAPGFESYPDFEYFVDFAQGQIDAFLPTDLTLPNLFDFGADLDVEQIDLDGNLPSSLNLATSPFSSRITGPMGISVTGDFDSSVSTLGLYTVYLAAADFVYELPNDLIIPSGLLFGPVGFGYSTPTATGLDLDLENDLGLAVDDVVDIWAVNPANGAWFNRSTESGIQGTVVDDGGTLVIRAAGIVNQGTLYAAALPNDVDCSTNVSGRIIDGEGTAVANLTIRTQFGTTTSTDANGEFSFEGVPAYDPLALTCTPTDLAWTIVPSPTLGIGAQVTNTILAADIVAGADTVLDDVTFDLPATGCIAGIINGMPLFAETDVLLSGPVSATVQPDSSGNFFECELPIGDYTVSYQFPQSKEPVTADVAVTLGGITTVALQDIVGEGTDNLDVYVKRFSDGPGSSVELLEGALVFITGTDDSSMTGLSAITDANGRARFESVDGPFDITASYDSFTTFGAVLRELMTGIQLDPEDGRADLLLGLSGDDSYLEFQFLGGSFTELAGTVSGLGPDTFARVEAVARESFPGFNPNGSTQADSKGLYSVSVTPNRTLDVWFTDYLQPQAPLVGSGDTLLGLGLSSGVAPLDFDEQQTLDFDLAGAAYAPFDQSLTIDDSGIASSYAKNLTPFVRLELEGPSQGISYSVDLVETQGATTFPSTAMIPASDAQALTAVSKILGFSIEDNSSPFGPSGPIIEYLVRMDDATPTSIALEFITAPTFNKGDQFTYPTSLNGHAFNSQLDTFLTETDTNGYELLEMLGYAVAFPPKEGSGQETAKGFGGGRTVVWTVLLPAGTEQFEFPSYSNGMLGLQTDALEAIGYAYLSGEVVSVRADSGVNVDYAETFSAAGQQAIETFINGYSSLRIGSNNFEIGVND